MHDKFTPMAKALPGRQRRYRGSARGTAGRKAALAGIACLLLALAASLPASAGPVAGKEKRIALVIGISKYQFAPPLMNPGNDARHMAEALRHLDFEVDESYDADFRTLGRALREFGIKAQNADAALIFYAGHGVQADHQNYILPSDAKLERERDLLYEALPLDLMLGEIAEAKKVGILLLDACRNNPFTDRVSRSITVAARSGGTGPKGLARIDTVPRNTIVVMATRADEISEDGDSGDSPFTQAILAHLQIPGLELGLFFRSVRDTVLRATNNRQEPYVFSSLGAEPFYFFPRPPNRPPVIGPIAEQRIPDTAGPTPLGLPRPTDPDNDPLTVQILALPHSGEIRIDGKPAAQDSVVTLEKFMTATFTPDGRTPGDAGRFDFLVADGHGGNTVGSVPITVVSSRSEPVSVSSNSSAVPPPRPDPAPAAVAPAEAPKPVLAEAEIPVPPAPGQTASVPVPASLPAAEADEKTDDEDVQPHERHGRHHRSARRHRHHAHNPLKQIVVSAHRIARRLRPDRLLR
jgi:hypothetical protein